MSHNPIFGLPFRVYSVTVEAALKSIWFSYLFLFFFWILYRYEMENAINPVVWGFFRYEKVVLTTLFCAFIDIRQRMIANNFQLKGAFFLK